MNLEDKKIKILDSQHKRVYNSVVGIWPLFT